jgi:predicted transcriptional regulator
MKTRLTNKQKIALWGLIKYPALNDRETSDKIKMKLSTLTTIRYKMLEEGLYKMVNVPVVNRMAFEMAAFFIIRLAPSAKNKELAIRKDEFPNLVYIAHDQNRILAYGFYMNYATAEADLNELMSKLRKAKMIARAGHWIKFLPLQNYDIPNYFEMSVFVNAGLELDRPEAISSKGSMFQGDPIHLSSFERKVLKELVSFPDETDVQLSKNLKITRSTVARIRERLLGLAYRTLNIVDLAKLNYKAISIAAPTFNYTYEDSRATITKAANSLGPPLFFVVGDYGGIYITAHKELRGIRSRTNNTFRGGPFKGHVHEPSHLATFSLKQLKVLRNHEYLKLTEQMLDLYQYRPKRRGKNKAPEQ